MTPKPHVYTPSAEDASEQPASEIDSGDESLPPHTSEIGTLKKLPNQGTAWLGSSSGVYFVNTVRRAFSVALADSNSTSAIPASEDILTGEGEDGRNYNGPVTDGPSLTDEGFRRGILMALGRPPVDRSLAMELVTTFFRCWHPLFPFLHGPRFLQDIDAVYAMKNHDDPGKYTGQESRRVVTLQLIINIASLDRKDLHLPIESRIKSTADVTRVAGCFCVNHDIAAIQLLIAAELYLVATISLRQASTVAGMILKLIYHAGLHRCPLRYAQLSLEDCEIRKRIFWSAYALDRHLSLSLGDPNTVQDNDIDVCLSGRELHKGVAHDLIINPSDEFKMHLPRPQTGPHGSGSPSDDPRVVNLNEGPQAREKQQREAAMTSYVHYGKLTGQIIEIFHKSIHARFQKPDAITFLNSDIETWWNDLPSAFTDEDDDVNQANTKPASQATSPNNTNRSEAASNAAAGTSAASNAAVPTHKQLAPFFMILYQQLLLLLNRPRLSLDQSTAEFQHGLQVCIKASRNTLSALKRHRDNGQSMLLPGLMPAAWMAGLIIAFACQLGKYPKQRACQDISSCLGILESMGWSNWFTVKNCHKVLSLLLENIKGRRASANGFLTAISYQHHRSESSPVSLGLSGAGLGNTVAYGNPRKRAYDDSNTNSNMPDVSPKRKSMTEASLSNPADSRMPPPPNSSRTPISTATSTSTATTAVLATHAGATHAGATSTRHRHQHGAGTSLMHGNGTNASVDATRSSSSSSLGEWSSAVNPTDTTRTTLPPTVTHTKTNNSTNTNTNTRNRKARSRSNTTPPKNSSNSSPFANHATATTTNTKPSLTKSTSTPTPSQDPNTIFTNPGAAVYTDLRDMIYAQSNHNLNTSNASLPSSGAGAAPLGLFAETSTPIPSFSFSNDTSSGSSPAGPFSSASSAPYIDGGGGIGMNTGVGGMGMGVSGMLGMDDPMFWGNFDYNVTDIFGAASFENLIGTSGPMLASSEGGGSVGDGGGLFGLGTGIPMSSDFGSTIPGHSAGGDTTTNASQLFGQSDNDNDNDRKGVSSDDQAK